MNQPKHDPTIVDDISPVHPDLALAVAYLAREATPEQKAEFEHRFVEDDAFFEYVAPIMKVWTMPMSFRERAAPTAATPPSAAEQPAAVATPVVTVASVPTVRPLNSSGYRRGRRYLQMTVTALVGVAALLTIFTEIVRYKILTPGREKILAETKSGYDAAMQSARQGGREGGGQGQSPLAAASVVPSLAAPPMPAPPKDKSFSLRDTAIVSRTPAGAAAAPLPDTLRATQEMVKGLIMGLGTDTRTGAGESKLVELVNGTLLRLRERTVVRTLPTIVTNAIVMLHVEGEVGVMVPAYSSKTMGVMVTTPGGVVLAMPSSEGGEYVPTQFAVRWDSTERTLQVAVARGRVAVSRALMDTLTVHATAGEFAAVAPNAAPRIVPAAEAKGFPTPDTAMRKEP